MANVGSSTATGVLGGAGMGASIGSMILPGIGTGVGAVLGAIVGGISGSNKAKDVNEQMAKLDAIPLIDPNQLAFKDTITREKKAVESGFTTDFQVARDIIGQSEAGGMSVASEIAQTNPALALMAMNQVSQGADMSINKALGTISTRSMGYTSMMADMVDKMSARSIQLSLLKAQTGLGVTTKALSDFNTNMNAGMMKGLGSIGDLGSLFKPGAGGAGAGFVNNPATYGNYDVGASGGPDVSGNYTS